MTVPHRGFPAGLIAMSLGFYASAWAALAAEAPAAEARQPPSEIRRRIVVCPFQNAGGEDANQAVGLGLTDIMTVVLADTPGLEVVDRTRLAAVAREHGLSLARQDGTAPFLRAGNLLRADLVQTGDYAVRGREIWISASRVDIASSAISGAAVTNGPLSEIVSLCAGLCRRLGSADAAAASAGAETDATPLLSLHFGRGIACYWSREYELAIMEFMRAAQGQGAYPTSLWMGKSYAALSNWPAARLELGRHLAAGPAAAERDEATALFEEAGRQLGAWDRRLLERRPGDDPEAR